MTSMLTRIPPKTLVVVAIVLLGAALVAGFALDVKAFGEHLLAELVGLLASVLVAVFVVDVLVERERARRWDLVAAETVASLRFAIIRAGLDVYLLLPAPRLTAADPFTMSEAGKGQLAMSLSTLARTVETAKGIELDTALNALRPHLAVARDSVMPRLLAIGQHELIASVATLEGNLQNLEYTVWLEERFGTVPDAKRDLAEVLLAMASVGNLTDEHAIGNRPAHETS
jgi:hypothetical protein